MTAVDEPSGPTPHDRRRALAAPGLLAAFNLPELLHAADVHVALRLGGLLEETDEEVLLATALAVRAVRTGLGVPRPARPIADVPLEADVRPCPWPEPAAWVERVGRSPLVREEMVRLVGTRLYLDRYWREEGQVCDDLVARIRRTPPEVDEAALDAGVLRVFPKDGYDEQRAAARAAASRWTAVLTGGPGTGKTTTVAGVLALVAEQHELDDRPRRRGSRWRPRPARQRPGCRRPCEEATEKLARTPTDRQRLAGLQASTLHRLLGWRPDSRVRFRHDRTNRLPYDVVVVDETSMVSLTMMARLLEAVRADARLVLVGDPDQLASVEAGAVLADLVAGFEDSRRLPGLGAAHHPPLRRAHRRAGPGAA